MKQFLFPSALTAIIFPIYALFGDAAISLLVGLLIGTVAALLFFELIGLNGVVVITVIAIVLYLLIGNAAFYLFGLLCGFFFCLFGLYALLELFRPAKGQSATLILLAISSPIAFSLGSYLIWTGVSELGLLPFFGIQEPDTSLTDISLSAAMHFFKG